MPADRIKIASEVADGLRCAVCEEAFGTDPRPRRYMREQGVMVHDECWED